MRTAGPLRHAIGGLPSGGGEPPAPSSVPRRFAFILQMSVLMVTLSTLRLPFRAAALLQGGVFVIGLWDFGGDLPLDANVSRDLQFILLPAILLLLALLLAAFTQESFGAERLLCGPPAGRRSATGSGASGSRREQIARARPGHRRHRPRPGQPADDGTGGGGTPQRWLDSGDVAAIRKMNGAVLEGAQMLGVLRLSLMEQTRALEGKPVPVDLRVEPLRPLVETGVRFQNRRATYGREIVMDGADREVLADRPRLVTVFMNLIGNALKYSDGEVRIVWRDAGDVMLVGVLERGWMGRGSPRRRRPGCSCPSGGWTSTRGWKARAWGWCPPAASWRPTAVRFSSRGTPTAAPALASLHHGPGPLYLSLTPGFRTGFVIVCPALGRRSDPSQTTDTDEEKLE